MEKCATQGELQIDAIGWNFDNFESALYMISVSMPLILLQLTSIQQHLYKLISAPKCHLPEVVNHSMCVPEESRGSISQGHSYRYFINKAYHTILGPAFIWKSTSLHRYPGAYIHFHKNAIFIRFVLKIL